MTRRLIGPLIFGVLGTLILLSLGFWQLQRLEWKEARLAEIDARIYGAPQPLPAPGTAREDRDEYTPVTASGRFTGEELTVLTSVRLHGAGYRLIAVFETDGRRIMVDRGFISEEQKNTDRAPQEARISGNLHWPQESDSFTPAPDLARGIWFARDVEKMAEALDTEPLLVTLRSSDETTPVAAPLPVDSSAVPNNHLGYAITWFSLAAVWAGMTAVLVWRIRRRGE